MVTVGGLKEGDELIVNIKIEKKATEGTIKCYFAEYNASQFDMNTEKWTEANLRIFWGFGGLLLSILHYSLSAYCLEESPLT